MGTFYGNVLVARKCAEVVPLLGGGEPTGTDGGVTGADGGVLRGYAMPAGPHHTVICPDPETDAIELGGPLSRLLGVPALSTYLFDSDVLDMRVYEAGELRHVYDSYPGYFDEDETDEDGNLVVGGGDDGSVQDDGDFTHPEPVGVDPEAFLTLAAGPVDRAALESVLRSIPLDPEDGEGGRYVFADDQHYDVMTLLGLDAARLTTGYGYLSRGELPGEMPVSELMVFGGARFGPAGA